jgi:hypothetical protein
MVPRRFLGPPKKSIIDKRHVRVSENLRVMLAVHSSFSLICDVVDEIGIEFAHGHTTIMVLIALSEPLNKTVGE